MDKALLLIFLISYFFLIIVRTYYLTKYNLYGKMIKSISKKRERSYIIVSILWIISIFIAFFDVKTIYIGFPYVLKIIASLLLLPNIFLFICAHNSLKENWNLPTEKSNTLIETGAYKYVRHPIYLTIIYLSVCLIIITSNLIITISQVVIITITVWKMIKEEIMLKQTLAGYDAYIKKTKRLIPLIF